MIKIKQMLLVGVACYIFCLIYLLPASLVRDDVQALLGSKIELGDVVGSLWKFKAGYSVSDFPAEVAKGELSWDFSLLPLFVLRIGGELTVEHPGLEVGFASQLGLNSVSVDGFTGTVTNQFINAFVEPLGGQVTGEISLDQIEAVTTKDEINFAEAAGALRYAGGEATVLFNGRQKRINVPALKGGVSEQERGIQLTVQTEQDGKQLGSVSLTPEGVVELSVLNRLLGVTGLMSVKGREDRPFLGLKEKLF